MIVYNKQKQPEYRMNFDREYKMEKSLETK